MMLLMLLLMMLMMLLMLLVLMISGLRRGNGRHRDGHRRLGRVHGSVRHVGVAVGCRRRRRMRRVHRCLRCQARGVVVVRRSRDRAREVLMLMLGLGLGLGCAIASVVEGTVGERRRRRLGVVVQRRIGRVVERRDRRLGRRRLRSRRRWARVVVVVVFLVLLAEKVIRAFMFVRRTVL